VNILIYEDDFGSHSFTRSESFSRSPAAVFLAGISLPGFVPAFFCLGFKLLSSLWLFPVARVICRRSVLRFPRAEFFPQASVRRSDFSHSGSFSRFCLVNQGLVQRGSLLCSARQVPLCCSIFGSCCEALRPGARS
jgi:hypothetical protein